MSIRKHLERMLLRVRLETDWHWRTRFARLVVVGLVSVLVLSGCAEGTASDAERGKAEDTMRTSVVTDLQATESAKLLKESSPEATATTAP